MSFIHFMDRYSLSHTLCFLLPPPLSQMVWNKNPSILFISIQLHIVSLCSSFCLLRDHSYLHKCPNHLRRTALDSSSNVNVYDGIFDTKTCTLLHELAVDHCNRCEAGSIFLRTPDNKDRLTPLEKAVDTILTALNDTSPIVEYWSRSCYINIDAHADIDEDTLKRDGILRCPKNAHVLYMQIANSGEEVASGEDRSKRMGPTVVFPDRQVAWGSTTAIPSINGQEEYVVDVENDWDDDDETEQQSNLASSSKEEMVIVPAKTGRLLRFDGRAFHAVPKPPHRYVMGKKELNAYLEEVEECDDDEYWDDEYDDYEQEEIDLENLRSVLLFNTWPKGSSGPRGVLPDTFVVDEDELPEDIELYSSAYDEYQSQMEKNRLQSWQEKYGNDFEQLWCSDIDDWKRVQIDQIRSTSIEGDRLTVPLMGNPSRRGCEIVQDVLNSPSSDMDTLFYDYERVSLTELEHKK